MAGPCAKCGGLGSAFNPCKTCGAGIGDNAAPKGTEPELGAVVGKGETKAEEPAAEDES